MNRRKAITILKALSDDTRLEVVRIIGEKGEISCSELQKNFRLSQPTLSHHFNKMVQTEIISFRKEGTSHIYSLNKKVLEEAGINIQKLIKIK